MRGWTPRKSESTSVGTSQSDMEERLPLSRWPPPLHRRQQGRIPSWTAAAGSFPPALRAGGALPTSHPEQLSPGCPVHEPEGPEPLAAPLPQSAITPTGAAVAPAPSLPPVRTGPSPPPPPTPYSLWIAALLGVLPPAPQEGAEPPLLPTRDAAGSERAAGLPTPELTASPSALQPVHRQRRPQSRLGIPSHWLCRLQLAQLPSGMRAVALKKVPSLPRRSQPVHPALLPSGYKGTQTGTAASTNSLSLSRGAPSQLGTGPNVPPTLKINILRESAPSLPCLGAPCVSRSHSRGRRSGVPRG